MHSLLDHKDQDHVAIFTDQVPMAATDAKSLMINPNTFFSKDMKLPHRLFVTSHEILHVVFEHVVLSYRWHKTGKVTYKDGTSLPYDHDTMNKAMDYIVNAVLITSKVGAMPEGEWRGLYDPTISATGDDDIVDVYRKLYKRQGGGGGGDGKNKSDDHGGGFCQHKQPGSAKGKSPDQTVAEHNSQEIATAVAAAANAAKLMGKLPAGLARVLERILEPQVSWRDHVRALIMRKAGSGGYDWHKADEELMMRDIYAPQRSGHGVDTIVCAVDTSGSVTQKEYDLFYSEVAGILDDIRPRHLHVIWCDAEINKSEEVDDAMDLLSAKVKGGGGTCFRPVFTEISRLGLKPDALIYLTDGQGRFPEQAPDYHVIWGSIYEPSKYPFGDVVQVPKQAA
jgi:predicted metal-dependent peptidase